jgi:hydrogenase nickel incorporation protein HypA/HybF
MHELTITQNVVRTVLENTDGRRVTRVRLTIGSLTGIVADAVHFCFDVATAGTLLQGANLEILEEQGQGRCRSCGAVFAMPEPFPLCRCGSTDAEVVAGRSLQVTSVEVV